MTWLIIADQSRQGVFDSDCMKLSQLHSDAVDYPKSGIPVDMVKIPRPHQRTKPDWNAPETLPAGIDSDNYYRSTRAIGRLFREISLPALQTVKKVLRSQSKGLREGRHVSLEKFTKALEADRGPIPNEDPVRLALQRRVAGFIEIGEHEESLVADIFDIFESYASQLQLICIDHTISPTSRSATAMLTEEEAVIGTIVAKCTQPRMRRDTMSKLREQTDILVQSIIQQLVGQDGNYDESSMERAWIAFRIAGMEGLYFGSKSFAWIALWVAFEAIKKVEESEGRI